MRDVASKGIRHLRGMHSTHCWRHFCQPSFYKRVVVLVCRTIRRFKIFREKARRRPLRRKWTPARRVPGLYP